MKKFVLLTGVDNIVAGDGFFLPGFVRLLGIKLPEPALWLWVVAATIIFSGIVLVLCSRNLATRAPVVYWEGFLRIAGFFLFGFLGDWAVIPAALGIVDLLIGLVYFIGLPKALNTSAADLLLDRVA